jgi:type I restriction enzyme S subunit
VEWLGKIPAKWEAMRLKFVARLQYGDSLSDDKREEGEVLVFGSNGPIGTHIRANTLAPALIIGRKGSYGKVNFSEQGCFAIDTTYFVDTRSSAADLRWLWYAFTTLRLDAFSEDSAVPGLSQELAHSQWLPKPPRAEQLSIASFLCRETAKIDALVAKKERLIELLQEKRAALITQAVTKGLDQTVPMKDSGVEWLGKIPAHWRICRNKVLFREHDQRSIEGQEELLTVSHITGVTRRSEKEVYMIEAESHEGYKLCKPGDLIINTMWAWMGALGIASESGMVSPSYNVYRFRDQELLPRYYDYLCRIPLHVSELTRYSKGVWKSRLRLYPEEFHEIVSPIPERIDQQAIVEMLGRETAKIDALIGKVREGIERLKEYRSALISAAVTGKIDVREEVAG